MKTSILASAGLVLGVAFVLSAMGCKTTQYYGSAAAPVDPGGEGRCKATCERLAEERAIPRSAAKACQSACQSPAPASPAKSADSRVADNACPSLPEDPPEAARSSRQDAPCQCKKGTHCVPCRPGAPPSPPPLPTCQDDSDCPDDTVCESGACQ